MNKLEQETITNFNEAEATASVYTHNAALIRKLEALADSRPGEAKRERSYPDGGRLRDFVSAGSVSVGKSGAGKALPGRDGGSVLWSVLPYGGWKSHFEGLP